MFFIFDADGNIFGNPKGYKKHRHAVMIAKRKIAQIWVIYDAKPRESRSILWRVEFKVQ